MSLLKKILSYGLVALIGLISLTSWMPAEEIKAIQKKDETVSFSGDVSEISSDKSITFDVAYVAKKSREIVVEIWKDGAWVANGNANVKKGNKVKKITVNMKKGLAPGKGYLLKLQLRPPGSTWKEATAFFQKEGVVVK
ncbi:hypothetical protein [Aquimarina agarilytica]|uniref:hypothetical protein n=1 Tax=Aquimarina agarilytica TaxID=1087449 RepID=UPI000289929D|nr:hypothetical protein [Aquimarina agarilytica]